MDIYSNGTSQISNYTMPTSLGLYSYKVVYNNKTVCSGGVKIIPILSCSVSPNTVNTGDSYTFDVQKGDGISSCWNCTYTYDSGTDDVYENLGPFNKTASKTGTWPLKMACTCDNTNAECSDILTIEAQQSSSEAESSSSANNDLTLDHSGEPLLEIPAGTTTIVMSLPENWHNGTEGTCHFQCQSNNNGPFNGTASGETLSGYSAAIEIPIANTINGYRFEVWFDRDVKCKVYW
ncbi:hypothetical protein [Fibrobacter intestinalis]|uniref:hypothetical protein n=1 Tax=Fibrobacter intestinalis TaxID=28122 RepID=UPI0023F55B81|nr:hypothetical protein [Fibrobacter intestinalis]MDD7299245.1 hypothetical protein [Fibrobacter intestinalis]